MHSQCMQIRRDFSINCFVGFCIKKQIYLSIFYIWYTSGFNHSNYFFMKNMKFLLITENSWLYTRKDSFFLVQYLNAFLSISLHAFRVYANPQSFSLNFFVNFFVSKQISPSFNNSWYTSGLNRSKYFLFGKKEVFTHFRKFKALSKKD